MEWGVKGDDFFDLCEQYLQLVEARERVLAQEGDPEDSLADELLAERIDDIDVQQRILMCRILFLDEQPREEALAVEQVHAGEAAAAGPESPPVTAAERETGGTARGRFALRELAGLLKVPFGKANSRFNRFR
jgi:hypothetical protein